MLQLGGTFFGTCSTEGDSAAKIVSDCPGFVLYTGASIYVKFTQTNVASVASLTLNVNGTGAHSIKRLGTTNIANAGALAAGLVCNFIYDGSNWLWVGQMDTDINTVPSAYCTTVANVAAKVAECTGFSLADNSYIHLILANGNNLSGAITLNINGTGAKSVYLNGSVTGANNYQIPAGSYIVYYDGSVYQLRTDGIIHGSMTGNVKSMTNDGSTIIYTMGDGSTASFVIPNTKYTAGASIKIENNAVINNGVRAVAQGTTNGTISVNTGGSTRDVSVKGLGSAAFEDAGAFSLASHTHGNITNLGNVGANPVTIANGDALLVADASDDNKLVKSAVAFDGESTNKFLTKAGTWETVNVDSAAESQHATSAGYAAEAGVAEEAIYASSAGYAMTAGHAVLAGTATWALDGRHASCANYATTAGYAITAGYAVNAAKATQDASGNVITTTYATKSELNSLLAANDAMIFKGTLGTGGDYTSVPSNSYQTGYTYKIITAGQYAGKTCEEGDLLIAINDGPSTGTSIIAADWTVAQGNLDGVVVGPASSASGSFAIFSGTTGKGITSISGKGTTSLPIYIDSNGRPQTISSYEGKAGSANYATNAGSAIKASSADYAANANSAANATEAKHAATATYAASAGYASTAGSSNTSGTASWAIDARRANCATYAENASQAVNASESVHATSADFALNATNAVNATEAKHAGTATWAASAAYASATLHAASAAYAANANKAANATEATHASSAAYAANANQATNATNATEATHASSAAYAANANQATNATNATHASSAAYAANANQATNATHASSAAYAANANQATNATNATHAASAAYAANANQATNATNATHASSAAYAANANAATNATHASSAAFATNASSAAFATNATKANCATFATNASCASFATNATNAVNATEAKHAATATYAASAGYASTANTSNTSGTASWAITANRAIYAQSATYVTTAQNAVHAGTATYATSATYADKAAKDADGNTISTTYVKANDFATKLAATDAMVYMGTLAGGSTSPGTFTPAAGRGDTYKVSTAGYINKVKCEVGDMFICLADSTATATSATCDTVQTKWSVIQTNLDGVVIGPANATSGQLAMFSDTTGKVVKAATISKGIVVTKVTLSGGAAPTLGSAITASYITGWSAGTAPSITISSVTASCITGWSAGTAPSITISSVTASCITAWNAGTLPSATVNNGVLIFYAGSTPSFTNTYKTVGSSSGWSAGTLPSMTNNIKAIPNVTNAGSSASITLTTASYVSGIA